MTRTQRFSVMSHKKLTKINHLVDGYSNAGNLHGCLQQSVGYGVIIPKMVAL